MRQYYNHRIGQGDLPSFNLHEVDEQVAEAFKELRGQGYFHRSFGYECVDSGRTPGIHGTLEMYLYRQTGIRVLVSEFANFIADASEVNLFTLIEFLHDHAAQPLETSHRYYHEFGDCGWHLNPTTHLFDTAGGRKEWRKRINNIIDLYEDGYELSEHGEIVRLAPDGMTELVEAAAPAVSGDTNVAKVANAVRIFRRGLSTREEQKQAVRDLADVLEFYRPQVKKELLKEDEAALFNIANNFAIRHHNANQKDEYDGAWLNYLFYLYLSTTHLVLALVHGTQMPTAEVPPPPAPSSDEEEGPPTPDDDDIPF